VFHRCIFAIAKMRIMTVIGARPSVDQTVCDAVRVAAGGRFLRSAKLNDLTPLFNGSRVDMSFADPQPHTVAYDKSFKALIDHYESCQHAPSPIVGTRVPFPYSARKEGTGRWI
jgi:lipopolysaccharide/colanic/teichoic acid biosynthesis glycosyltransferase